VALVTGVLLGSIRPAWGSDAGPPMAPESTDARPAWPPWDHRSLYRGIAVSGAYEAGTFGQAIPWFLGAETAGVRSMAQGRVIVSWDAAAGGVAGYGGNEHPGFGFAGGRLDTAAELGYRFVHERAISPYVATGAQIDLMAIAVLSAPPGGARAMNDLGGLAGTNGWLLARWGAGGSLLTRRHSFEIMAFAQEALRAPASWDAVALYFEYGARVHEDLSRTINCAAEVSYGRPRTTFNRAFGSSTEAWHAQATVNVKKTLGKGFWVALDLKMARDGHHTVYSAAGTTYDTFGILYESAGLTLGVPIR